VTIAAKYVLHYFNRLFGKGPAGRGLLVEYNGCGKTLLHFCRLIRPKTIFILAKGFANSF
jgi:hypothetical protein